ncbi:MAG: hypothetical protein N0C84_00850 [Candidatus Thiodiazotropha taylori]|uniref:Uncharacterized protein n=1 Tax=Candidatus Thiodiazotropha taylori TaxID=2792791 RepID=A0A9E4N2K2_9GAMM|nr:hypothetical protein [Candidatus Thiodiazotropha taylori]MCW4254993.1 hypothetical protein [Candidatus Thiodiazotropha taylori]
MGQIEDTANTVDNWGKIARAALAVGGFVSALGFISYSLIYAPMVEEMVSAKTDKIEMTLYHHQEEIDKIDSTLSDMKIHDMYQKDAMEKHKSGTEITIDVIEAEIDVLYERMARLESMLDYYWDNRGPQNPR